MASNKRVRKSHIPKKADTRVRVEAERKRIGWLHLNLWFDTEELDKKHNLIVREYFREVIRVLKVEFPYMDDYFYLYEPSPHVFLALSLVTQGDVYKAMPIIDAVKRPPLILRHSFSTHSTDEWNGRYFLNILHEFSKFVLFGDADEQYPNRPKGLLEFDHVLHCIMDMYYGSREDERSCYKRHLKWYGSLPKSRR